MLLKRKEMAESEGYKDHGIATGMETCKGKSEFL